jgi:hypothetical protein
MRLVAHIPAKPEQQVSAKRIIIATNPQSASFYPPGWVIMYGGYQAEDEDGPSMSATAYPTVEDALAELEDLEITGLQWQEYPDQLPGCQDDWLGPVRIYRDESGAKVFHRWQRLVEGEWVEFEGPSDGYGLQIA